MSLAANVSAVNHTTRSSPSPHIIYTFGVDAHGESLTLEKRYSEFLALDRALGIKGRFTLPPKRLLATTFIPSAWIDDALIAERKLGLQRYLRDVLNAKEYRSIPALSEFLKTKFTENRMFELEDALPSTLSRKKAMEMAKQVSASVDALKFNPPVAAGYYPDWIEATLPPEKIAFDKFDIVYFAFVTPNSSSTINWSKGSSSQSLLQRLIQSANNSGKGTRIILSVGGWGGSYWFSDAVSTNTKRTKFVDTLYNTVNNFGLAGIDIDWEYPNSPGAGNLYSANDATNYLQFITALRAKLGTEKIISAAVSHVPWLSDKGSPLTDVSKFAEQMDFVNIMNYDVWGASENPGPNAPLGNLCGTSTQPRGSAQAALEAWTKAKFPASKLMLGLALYGYVSKSKNTKLSGSFAPAVLASVDEDASKDLKDNAFYLLRPVEDDSNPSKVSFLYGAHPRSVTASPETTEDDGEEEEEETEEEYSSPSQISSLSDEHPRSVTASPEFQAEEEEEEKEEGEEGDVSAEANSADLRKYYGQQIAFNRLVTCGALVRNSNGSFGQSGGFTFGWDNCSDTPFLFRTDQATVVSFDDTNSLSSKAKWAKSVGMAGVFTWSLDQDYEYCLMNAVRLALGR